MMRWSLLLLAAAAEDITVSFFDLTDQSCTKTGLYQGTWGTIKQVKRVDDTSMCVTMNVTRQIDGYNGTLERGQRVRNSPALVFGALFSCYDSVTGSVLQTNYANADCSGAPLRDRYDKPIQSTQWANVALWNFFHEGNCQPFGVPRSGYDGSRGSGFRSSMMLSAPLPKDVLPTCLTTAASAQNMLWRYAQEDRKCSNTKHKHPEAVVGPMNNGCSGFRTLDGAQWQAYVRGQVWENSMSFAHTCNTSEAAWILHEHRKEFLAQQCRMLGVAQKFPKASIDGFITGECVTMVRSDTPLPSPWVYKLSQPLQNVSLAPATNCFTGAAVLLGLSPMLLASLVISTLLEIQYSAS